MRRSQAAWVLCAALAAGAPQDPPVGVRDPFAKIAERPAQPPVDGGIPVEVRDENGDPVAGAAVVVITQEELATPFRAVDRVGTGVLSPFPSLAELAASMGTKFVTGENGRTSVSRTAGGIVMAFNHRRVTLPVASPGRDGLIRLAFGPLLEMEVEVVDAGGQPAKNVTVGVGTTRSPSPVYIGQARTDAQGRAHVRVERAVLEGSTIFVEPVVPLHEPLYRELEVTDLEPEAIRFQLPPTGQLRIILYDEHERPRSGVESAVLREVTEPNPRLATSRRRRQSYPPSVLEADNALFAHVELGMEFEALVTLRGIQGSVTARTAGPTRPREVIVLPIRAVEGPPVLTLRVVDARGQPIVEELLGVGMRGNNRFVGRIAETDAEGVLRIAFEPELVGEDASVTVFRRAPGEFTTYRGAARADLTRDLQPGENPAVDLTLEDEPVLVGGQIVDGEGNPIPGVEVRTGLAMDSGTRSSDLRWQGLVGTGPSLGFGSPDHQVETDEEGRFTMRELLGNPATVSLHVDMDGYILASGTRFAAGTADARIVLLRAGRVLGGFGEFPRGAEILVRLVGGQAPDAIWRRADQRDGSFAFTVLPGNYSLQVRVPGSAEPALTIPDLAVEAGQIVRDPRVQDIDWRAFFRAITITVLDELHRPLPRVATMAYGRRNDGVRVFHGSISTNDEGQVTHLIRRDAGARFEIESEDHLVVRLENVTEDQQVVLQPRPIVEVTLEGELGLPEDVVLVGHLSSDRWTPFWVPFQRKLSQFDRQGVARIPLPTLEPLQLTIDGLIGFRTFSAIPSLRRDIVIDPETGPRPIVIGLTDEHRRELQEAIERARR